MPAANELLERALNETANLKSGEVFDNKNPHEK